MSELDKDTAPQDEEQQPNSTSLDPILNPFSGKHPTEQQPKKLGMNGSKILGGAGIKIPTENDANKGYETSGSVSDVAKEVCGLIAEMYVDDTDPKDLIFPKIADVSVINEALSELTNTPLGLGYGAFPKKVEQAWVNFIHQTMDEYRKIHQLNSTTLVPLEIDLPEWLEGNPNFDILPDLKLVDIVINGNIQSTIATGAKNSRVTFKDTVTSSAHIGIKADRSSFIFEKDMDSSSSFRNAKNVLIDIKGNHATSGSIGPIERSKIICRGSWRGDYLHEDMISDHSIGDNVNAVKQW